MNAQAPYPDPDGWTRDDEAAPRPKNEPRLPPAELRPEWLTAIIDTREQKPLHFAKMKPMRGTLATGDYSVLGLESQIAVERKSLADLLQCVGAERERFEREVQRLLAYPTRALVVESTWGQLELGGWRSRVSPRAAVGSLLGWMALGLPVVMAGDHLIASRMVERLLFIATRRRWRENRALCRHATREAEAPAEKPPGGA